MSSDADVIIAGAGPSGLFLACRLIQMNKRVIVLEKEATLPPAVRAICYFAPTQRALDRAGLFKEAARRGYFQMGFSWRKTTRDVGPDEKAWGELIAAWNPWEDSESKLGDCGHGMLTLGQDELREICLEKLGPSKHATVLLGHPVVALDQSDDLVTVNVTTTEGQEKSFTAPWLIGADGAHSATRKLINQSLNGYTWPHFAVGCDLLVNLPPPTDGPNLVYLLDQKNMGMFCPQTEPKKDAPIKYRFTFPLSPAQCEPDVFEENVRKKIEHYVPGKRPLDYKLLRSGKYAVHQRQVDDYLVGRVMLIGDAAHLNSSTGGLGLTTGLLDADSLADAFDLIYNDDIPDSVFRTWADARRAVWRDIVNPMSAQNTQRVVHADPENPKADPFLKMVMEKDTKIKVLNDTFNNSLITDLKQILADQKINGNGHAKVNGDSHVETNGTTKFTYNY